MAITKGCGWSYCIILRGVASKNVIFFASHIVYLHFLPCGVKFTPQFVFNVNC